jgi:adenylate cyclase
MMEGIKSLRREHLFVLLAFTLGANLFYAIKLAGINEYFYPIEGLGFDQSVIFLRITLTGFLTGMVILLHETYLHPKIEKSLPLIIRRFLWQIDVALIIVICAFLTGIGYNLFNTASLSLAIAKTIDSITSSLFLSFFVFYFLLSVFVNFLRRLRVQFGQEVFTNYLLGKYSDQVEEERTFLFLDLNDSTSLAENLGHVKYSRLLNMAFQDIIDATETFSPEVYQFVGDEVVFTWLSEKDKNGLGIMMVNAVNLKIETRAEEYKAKFGSVPKFKAAISSGSVSVSLVGKKKNLAYHGDVLNTTARLLGQCKKYKTELLVTEFYSRMIKINASQELKFVGSLQLRGKENFTNIYKLA